jgi:beta-glucosidase
VTGVANVVPTGTVDVWVNGARKGSATLDARGTAVVRLPQGTRTSLVVVTYAGDRTYLPWIATPHLLVVR